LVARLREQLAERDEIIVALQHVIRDLQHEVVNLRVGSRLRDFRPRASVGGKNVAGEQQAEDDSSRDLGNGIAEGRIELALAEAAVAAYVDAARFYELALAKLAHQREERKDA
jgi:hypothetical protein